MFNTFYKGRNVYRGHGRTRLDPRAKDATNPVVEAYLKKLEDACFHKDKKVEMLEQGINWSEISAKLPSQRTPKAKHARQELFKRMDLNHDGVITEEEAQIGVCQTLGLGDLFDPKPACKLAFNAAKGVSVKKAAKKASPASRDRAHSHARKSKAKPTSETKEVVPVAPEEDTVDLAEFRLLLSYLREYFELYAMFEAVDTTDDMRVEQEEFCNAMPKLESWGVHLEDPVAEFKGIDFDNSGSITFDEFADWALKMKLDLEDDDDNDQ